MFFTPQLILAEVAKAPMHPIGVAILVGGGLFSILGAWRNWDWFFAWSPAPLFVALFGRKGARIFYSVIGLGLCVFGALAGLGKIR